jgi:hypothetical protein
MPRKQGMAREGPSPTSPFLYDVSADSVQFLDAVQFDGGRPEGQRGPGGGTGCSNLEPMDSASAAVMDAKIFSLQGCGLLVTLRAGGRQHARLVSRFDPERSEWDCRKICRDLTWRCLPTLRPTHSERETLRLRRSSSA